MVDTPQFDDSSPVEPLNAAPQFDASSPVEPLHAEAPHDFSWGQMATDIWPEIKKEAGTAYKGITDLSKRGEQGPVEGMLNTANAVLSVPRLIASPATGTIKAIGGHGMANAEHAVGSLIAPETAAKDNPETMYETAKNDVDKAMSAARPAGAPIKAPNLWGNKGFEWAPPPKPVPTTSTTPEVVSAAQRASEASGVPINVPRAFASDSIATQRMGQLARNVPIVGDSIPRATGEMVDQMGDAVGAIASHYGEGSGPNVASRIANTIPGAAEAETNSAQTAARLSDEALLADWQRAQDEALHQVGQQETEAENLARTSNESVLADWQRAQDDALHQVSQGENTALTQARNATGDMSPQDMGQALIGRLRTEEAAARAHKDSLYDIAGEHDASVTAKSVRGVHGLVTDTLNEAGRTDPRTGKVDPLLLPASTKMMDELDNFSGTARPTRDPDTGRMVAGSPATAQEMEQTRKRLVNLSGAATNDSDIAAAKIIKDRFDEWQGHAYENALFSGSPEALQAFRDARAANTSWRQRFYNDRDDADGIINRVVTGEVTPQEMSNWIVGSGQVGAKGVASRLITRLGQATAGDPEAMNTIRAGIANRLFGTTEGATARSPEKIANDIHEFFNGSGSDVAGRLFTPEQRNAALNYANAIRRGQESRQDIAAVAKATKPTPMEAGPMKEARQDIATTAKLTKPTPMEVGPGPMQELATAILGKSGKADESLFAAIDAYAKSGGRGDIKTLADIVRNIPAKDKGDLAGAIIRKLGYSDQAKGFSPEKFATEWAKYTPQAKAILFGNSGPHRQALDDIAMIAQRYKEVGRRFGNPSGTAQNVVGFGSLAAVWTHPFTAIPALIGGTVFAQMLSKPATAQKTAGLFKTAWEMSKNPTPGNMARLTYAGSNFARLAEKAGSNLSVPQFLQQLSGPGVSRADQQPADFNDRFGAPPTTGRPSPRIYIGKNSGSEHARGGSVKKNNIKGYAEGGNAGDDYNTVLSPEEEQKYQAWKAQTAPDDSGVDYDLRGAYLADMQRSPDNGHMGDRFKKPNHPTFSDQSQYAIGDQRQRAGTWVGPEGPDQTFVPPTPYGRGGRARGYADGGDPSAADLASQAEDQLYPRLNSLPAPTDNTNVDTAMLPSVPDTRPEWIKNAANAPHPVFWPERLLGSGLTLAHDVMSGEQPMPPPGLRREDYTDIPAPGVGDKAAEPGMFGTGINRFLAPQEASPYDPAYERVQDMAALAGSGGLGAGAEDAGAATLGSGPFLRPALKHEGKIYKAPIKDPNQPLFFGAEHSDALPAHLQEDFYQKAHNGEDINDYKFGFMNHKGQFLEREPALDYGVKEGLVDPYNARYGTLTSTMLSDTSEPGAALSALEHSPTSRAAVEQSLINNKGGFSNLGVPENRDPNTGAYIGQVPKFQGRDQAGRFEKSKDPYRNLPDINTDQFGPQETVRQAPLRQNGKFISQAEYYRNRTPSPEERTALNPNEMYTDQNAPSPVKSNLQTAKEADPEAVARWKANMPLFSDSSETGAPLAALEHTELPPNEMYTARNSPSSTTPVTANPNKLDVNSTNTGYWKASMPNSFRTLSDTSQNAPLAALEHQQPFYSAVEKTIQSAPQSKMHGEQWANWIKNQPGVKPDELQYTGVDNWLRTQKGPVTKQQVQDYIANNKVQVNDVVKGEMPDTSKWTVKEAKSGWGVYDENGTFMGNAVKERAKTPEEAIQTVIKNNPGTKYSQWQLAEGSNYREHLLTLPNKPLEAVKNRISEINDRLEKTQDGMDEHYGMKDDDFVAPGKTVAQKRLDLFNEQRALLKEKSQLERQQETFSNYKSSHWDEPNILAHVRTNDRDVGGIPAMHIEEIQSDWHQQGRDKGYNNKEAQKALSEYESSLGQRAKDKLAETIKEKAPEVTDDTVQHVFNHTLKDRVWEQSKFLGEDEVAKHRNLYEAMKAEDKNGVPDAPFKKSWPELAMKRTIRQAVEEGKSRVSWTPGEAQAARYDLSKQVNSIEYRKNPDNTYRVNVLDKKNSEINLPGGDSMTQQQIESALGKEIAEKIVSDKGKYYPGSKNGTLDGLDLKVGGEGMKDFYDQMMPKMVEKLGKQYGVRVKEGQVQTARGYPEKLGVYDKRGDHVKDFNTMAEARAYLADPRNGVAGGSIKGNKAIAPKTDPVHYFDIPKAMAEKVKKEGFPLFSDTNTGMIGQTDSDNKKNIPRPEQEKERARASGGRVVASNINHAPSEAQKKAGNYAKDHVHVHGLDITIENAKGSTRSGRGKDGKEWKSTLPSHYGYIKRTEGADKDHLDIYLGPHIRSDKVYVVNQISAENGHFDEHKIFIGFRNLKHVIETYEKAFSDGKGLQRVGSVVPTDIKQLKEWLKTDTKKPYELPKNIQKKAA